MILIGQYDLPFVRRVAITMRLYDMDFEHRPWSVFADAEKIAAYNPLRRVPTLVRSDGAVLVDSASILDWLDEQVGERALIPRAGEERRRHLHICALATGLAEKAVALLYERVLHEALSQVWSDRCRLQIADVLAALERAYAGLESDYWFGARMGHADIAVACSLRFVSEAHPDLFELARAPRLSALAERCETTAPFAEIVQRLVPPK